MIYKNETSLSSLRHSFAVQRRVIGALMMREILTRYGRDNLGFMWLFVEPMIFTLGVASLWAATGMHHGSSMPIIAFAITGYSSVLLWRNCASRCSMAILPNMNLLYHRNVKVMDFFLTRILLEFAGATTSFLILSFVFIAAEWMAPPVDMLRVILGWGLLAWFGLVLGIILGAGTAYSEVFEKLWHPTSYLLFPLSGAAFMVDWLPQQFREFVLLLPMVHGVEILREGYFGNTVRTYGDVAYMSTVCLILTLVGLAMVHDASRRVEIL